MAAKKDNGETGTIEEGWLQELRDMTQEEFKKLYPLTHALILGWDKAVEPVLRVISQVTDFRRGGIAHSTEPTLHSLRDLHPLKIEQILAEPSLTAELVEKPEEPADPEASKTSET
jgi:hypothetical protein